VAKKKETKKKFKNGKCKVLIICYFSFFFSFSDVKNKIENKKEVLMAWKKYKLGELIELCDERNTEGITEFYGININKEFMPTVANTEGLDESKYKVVRKNRFVFSGMQTGRDVCIRISMYMKDNPIIVSPAYTTFEVKKTDIVSPTYFFMLFLSKEMDRLGWFCSDGSIRSNLDWDRFCDFDISLPSLDVQKQYAAVYQAACDNMNVYQSRLDSLKTVCDGYIEKLRTEIKPQKIGKYIEPSKNERNSDKAIFNCSGITVLEKSFA
jgi:type I restriction enzyme S subunit